MAGVGMYDYFTFFVCVYAGICQCVIQSRMLLVWVEDILMIRD